MARAGKTSSAVGVRRHCQEMCPAPNTTATEILLGSYWYHRQLPRLGNRRRGLVSLIGLPHLTETAGILQTGPCHSGAGDITSQIRSLFQIGYTPGTPICRRDQARLAEYTASYPLKAALCARLASGNDILKRFRPPSGLLTIPSSNIMQEDKAVNPRPLGPGGLQCR